MEGGRGDDGKDQQRRGKGKMNENQTPNPQPHYNCPRCNSKNTKFCYYNNYSINQPRYFCKTCRRYWTQGGSQRNVPVGGGTRRGRRDKVMPLTNGEGSSRPVPPGLLGFSKPLHMPKNLSGMLGFLSKSYGIRPANPPMDDASSGITASMNSLYSCGGGFVSSLDAMQNLNLTPQQPPPQGFNRPLRIDGNQMANRPQQAQVPNNSEDMNNRGKEPMYPSDEFFFQATRPMGPWDNQVFSNNSNDPMASSSSNIWNTSDDNAAPATSNDSIPDVVLNVNEWTDDLPEFDPPEF